MDVAISFQFHEYTGNPRISPSFTISDFNRLSDFRAGLVKSLYLKYASAAVRNIDGPDDFFFLGAGGGGAGGGGADGGDFLAALPTNFFNDLPDLLRIFLPPLRRPNFIRNFLPPLRRRLILSPLAFTGALPLAAAAGALPLAAAAGALPLAAATGAAAGAAAGAPPNALVICFLKT